MIENLEQVIKLFIVLVDVIVILTFVFTLIKGFGKGFYKYLLTDGLRWILILIIIMFSKTIAETILTASYPGIGQLNTYLINIVCEEFNLDYTSIANSYTYDLVYGVVLATVRLIIIYLTVLVVSLIVYPIIQLILKIFGIRRLVNNIPKNIVIRILGVVLAFVTFGIYFTITYLPYYGTMNVILKVEEDSKILNVNNKMEEVESSAEIIIADYIDSSFIYPLFSGENSVAVKYLNSLYVVEIKTKNLYLIDEYYIIRDAFPIVIEYAVDYNKGEDVTPTVEDVAKISNILQKSESIEVLLPIVIEVAVATDFFDKYGINITFEELHNVSWNDEKLVINNILSYLSDFYEVIYGNMDNIKEVLATDEFIEITPKLINSLFDLYLLKEYGYEIIKVELENYINNNVGIISDILSLIEVKALIENDLPAICNIIQELYLVGIFDQTGDLPNLKLESEQQLRNLLKSIFSLSFIEDNEESLMKMIVKVLDAENQLAWLSIEIDYTNIDWDNELDHIAHLIYLFYEDNKIFESINDLKNEENKEKIIELFNAIIDIDLINKSIARYVANMEELESFKSDWLNEQCEHFDKEAWKDEIIYFVDLLSIIQTNTGDLNNIQEIDTVVLHDIFSTLLKMKSFNLDSLVDMLNTELQNELGTENTYLVYNQSIVWEYELNLLFSENGIFDQFKSLDENSTFESYGKLIDSAKKSSMFKDNIYGIIRDYIKTFEIYKTAENPNGIITDEDLQDSVFDQVTSWENELKLMDSIDINSNIQTGETLDVIMQSVLLKRQVKVYIKNTISEYNLSEYYLEENMDEDIQKVNQKIQETKLDNDLDNDYSWEKEVNALSEFSAKLSIVKSGDISIATVFELKNIAESGIITQNLFEKVKEEYPEINSYL